MKPKTKTELNAKPWPPEEWSDHLIAMGRIIFCWNNIEDTFRRCLVLMHDRSTKTSILTTHMGSNTWLDAMRTFAGIYFDAEEKDHIEHAINLFTRLREYRNFYVHGFSRISASYDGTQRWAEMISLKARKTYVAEQVCLSSQELHDFALQLSAAKNYYSRLHNYFGQRYRNKSHHQKLPEKFPIPDKMTKDQIIPRIVEPQPQSSGE